MIKQYSNILLGFALPRKRIRTPRPPPGLMYLLSGESGSATVSSSLWPTPATPRGPDRDAHAVVLVEEEVVSSEYTVAPLVHDVDTNTKLDFWWGKRSCTCVIRIK